MLALVSFLVASAVATPQPSASPVPPDAAVIVNSGSTNILGYRIVVRPNGAATVVLDGVPNRDQKLEAATAAAFFKDLAAAMPLGDLVAEGCMKSASFGSRTTIEYKGQRSPNVSCPMTGVGADLGRERRTHHERTARAPVLALPAQDDVAARLRARVALAGAHLGGLLARRPARLQWTVQPRGGLPQPDWTYAPSTTIAGTVGSPPLSASIRSRAARSCCASWTVYGMPRPS